MIRNMGKGRGPGCKENRINFLGQLLCKLGLENKFIQLRESVSEEEKKLN